MLPLMRQQNRRKLRETHGSRSSSACIEHPAWLPVAVALLSCVVWSTRQSSASEPFGVHLMRPDSLAGWDHGATPSGWTIASSHLTGTAQSIPLLSGFSFGDFELRFHWSVAPGAQWKVLFPEVPHGDGLKLVLAEGKACGRLTDGSAEIAGGGSVGALGDRMHSAAVCRSRGKFSVTIDGHLLYEVGLSSDRRFGLGLAVAGDKAQMDDLRVQEPLGQPIFNGKDLTGWWTPASLSDWKAENNELVLVPHSGNYLRTEKLFGNFTLTLQYKAQKGCNSGIGIRTPRPAWPSGDGMELQIMDSPWNAAIDKHSVMAIYGNVPPLARNDRSLEWNDVVVKADGWMISAWMNGELVQQYNTHDHPELKHRNLKGWIGFQDHGGWVHFRKVRVLESPDGCGLEAWSEPKPPRATAVVIDRVMNPEQLALPDGMLSGVVVKRVPAVAPKSKLKREQVLAQLIGPGAVVRIAQLPPTGRLAFYFDGEAKPRIECKATELPKNLPILSEDPGPILTCLTYKKSLEVVLKDAKQTEVRLDYVTFPKDYGLASFTDLESGFPRGWIPATHYRHGQCAWGSHREFDPAPRMVSRKKTITPDSTAALVEVRGAGTVLWLKLQADKKVLDNDDLWLQATVDGEPAISAPARFWYPHLAGQANSDNFVMTDRGGPTLRLAMPYARGVRIDAINRGSRPLRDVAATISYEPATPQSSQDVLSRMRLHGIYQPPCETGELIRQEGCGRWIGWIVDQPKSAPLGIDSLVVDGSPVAGWAAPNFDLLLGRSGEFRSCLSGRHGNLAWQYLWLAPVEFQRSLVLKADAKQIGGRLALFYLKK